MIWIIRRTMSLFDIQMLCFYTFRGHPRIIAFHYRTVEFILRAHTVASHLYRKTWIWVSYMTDINDVATTEFTHALVLENRTLDLTPGQVVISNIFLHYIFITRQREENRRTIVGYKTETKIVICRYLDKLINLLTPNTFLSATSQPPHEAYFPIPFHPRLSQVFIAHICYCYIPAVL